MSSETHQQPKWYQLDAETVMELLGVSARGLSSQEAQRRLAEYGPNRLTEASKKSIWTMILGQFADFMILVLLAAAVISGIVGELQDTIAIVVIVLLNAIVGAVQEFRAERAVTALREMAALETKVLRGGQISHMMASELVPGDIVILEAGNVAPADLRLLQAKELSVDESALTGESIAILKQSDPLAGQDLSLGDRNNLLYKNSMISKGRGEGVVIATGMDTEIGRIAGLLDESIEVKTPLQLRLTRFGRYLAFGVLAICTVVFLAGLLQGQPWLLMFLTAVSLAVAAIPEALPAVVTISLAFGARNLSRLNALVRNLPAVETLGSVTYICTDKTGTLTENRMTVEKFYLSSLWVESLSADDTEVQKELGIALALNNDVAEINGIPTGDPTELALFESAKNAGYCKTTLARELPRIGEIPFDSDRKKMTTLHQTHNGRVAYMKGAPERVLPQCRNRIGKETDDGFAPEKILAEADKLAREGYRVLAFAKRSFSGDASNPDPVEAEKDLSFIGLVALIDPPRPEVPQAVADCLSAGITPVMITGDHPGTAFAIAKRLGILNNDGRMLTGQELARLSDDELITKVPHFRVYARVSPEQKIRIVKALQAHGQFVAMTGDGVNDAPALKQAGIGVAMGQKGTDAAREAADMVLLDDNFTTIVSAVREGRRIFDNIRKFIKDTMSSNSGEIWTLFLAPFLGLPIPLLPIHILWINLITDGLPGLAFSAEPAEKGIMNRRPRPPQENILAHGMWQHIIWVGLFVAALSISAQAWSISRGAEYWQTVVFTVLTISQLFHSLAVRSESASLISIGVWSNLPMLGAIAVTVLLQLAVIYMPALNAIFHTQPLPLFDLTVCFALSSLVLVFVEVEKWLIRNGKIYTQ